jgi:long-subunit acyl-CoA synthetase (AMP-forming)
MKLSQGEQATLERIENSLAATLTITQTFIYSHSLPSYPLAVIIPDPVNLARLTSHILWTKITGANTAVLDEVTKDEKVIKAILDILTRESVKNRLKGYEYVRWIHISNKLFLIKNSTLTPMFEVKWKGGAAEYRKELDVLYVLGSHILLIAPRFEGSLFYLHHASHLCMLL